MEKFSHVLVLLTVITFSSVAQEVNSPAPQFSGKNTRGEEIKLADYKGKVVLLDFWASWCIPCRMEMPFLIELYEEFKDEDFVILAINVDDDAKNMEKFLSRLEKAPAFPTIFDKDKKIPPLYNLAAMPTTVFIDREGIIRYRHQGFKESHKEEYRHELTVLLKEKDSQKTEQ